MTVTNYILNFHLSGEIRFGALNYVHGALVAQYQAYPTYQSKGGGGWGDGLIGAVILCVNMSNAVLYTVPPPSGDVNMDQLVLNKIAAKKFIEDALKTCKPSGGDPEAVDSIWHLGECFFPFFTEFLQFVKNLTLRKN